MQIILLLIAIKVRKNKFGRTVVFAICLLWAFSLEYVTTYLEKNWKTFGFSDNYFDEFGVFAAVFFALPPLFIAILLLSNLIGNLAEKIIQNFINKKQVQKQKPQTEVTPDASGNNESKEENNENEKEEGKIDSQ